MAKKKIDPVLEPDWQNKPYERRGRGRPTKLSPALQKALCEVIELCNSLEDAAAYVGVERTTVFKWVQRGREETTGIYRDFFVATELAKARRRVGFNAKMLDHGKRKWEATAWLAERTDPKHFGLRIKVQVNEELERMMDKLARHLTPAEYEHALEALAQPDDSGEEAGEASSLESPNRRGLAAGVGAAIDAALHEPDSSS